MRPFRDRAARRRRRAIVVLCLLRLYPLALVAAAVAVPLLFVLYLWDVDLYEDEPLLVLAFTVAWGALAGAGLGLAAREVASQGRALPGRARTRTTSSGSGSSCRWRGSC